MPELTAEEHRAIRTYQAAGQEFIKHNPGLNEQVLAADKRGLTMSNYALREIIKSGERGVRLTHYLVQPENFDAAKKLHDLKDENEEKNQAEVQRQLAWVDRHCHGVEYERPMNSTDKYLAKREQDIKAGLRRR